MDKKKQSNRSHDPSNDPSSSHTQLTDIQLSDIQRTTRSPPKHTRLVKNSQLARDGSEPLLTTFNESPLPSHSLPHRTSSHMMTHTLKSHASSKRRKQPCCTPLMRSYVIEWCFIILVLVVPLACAVMLIPFRSRSISLLDASLQQPYITQDSLPILSVFIPSVLVPLVCFQVYPWMLSRWHSHFGLPKHSHSFRYSYWWSSCIIQTVGLTVLLSELSKRLVQAPRPDFLERCFPDGIPSSVQEGAAARNYIFNTDACTPASNAVYEDGLQSFPSEHTSLSWCMCSVLILFFYTIRRELLQFSQPTAGDDVDDYVDVNSPHGQFTSAPLHPPNLIAAPTSVTQSASHLGDGLNSHRASPSGNGIAPQILVTPPPPSAGAAVGSDGHSRTHSNSQHLNSQRLHAPPVQADSMDLSEPPAPLTLLTGASFWPNSHVVYIAHILIPFGWAIAVSFSRTFDHRHHVHDIIAGALLGIGVAYAVFQMHLSKFNVYHKRWQAIPQATPIGSPMPSPMPPSMGGGKEDMEFDRTPLRPSMSRGGEDATIGIRPSPSPTPAAAW